LISKIVEEEEQKEVIQVSKEIPNEAIRKLKALTFRKKEVHILLAQILKRLEILLLTLL
jgi:hypothetical protein